MTDRLATLLPRPRSARPLAGTFTFTERTTIVAGPGADGTTELVRRALGFLRLPLPQRGTPDPGAVVVTLDTAAHGPEGYQLLVRPERLDIVAGSTAGAVYAVQTLRQLLPDAAWRAAAPRGTRWALGCCEVTDAPALSWRGVMLDVSRHFLPKHAVLRMVDLLAMHKLNRLHLHLADDQGWRVESARYPRLTELASHRPHTAVGHGLDPRGDDGTPHGGFYTRDDLAEIDAYARERAITVVPELDVPGHASALLTALPELGSVPGGNYEVQTSWGIFPNLISPLPAGVAAVGDLLEELLEVLPGPYVHLGGDECPLGQWEANPEIQAHRESLGLPTTAALHGDFLRRLADRVAQRGVRSVFWDEAFGSGGLREDSVVMAWRGNEVARKAAAAGFQVVRNPVFPTYLDYYSEASPEEPLAIGGPVRLADVAAFAPRPDEFSSEENNNVIGTQAQLWSEYLPDARMLDYRAFPRVCALADVAWGGAPSLWLAEQGQVTAHLSRLDAAGVEYRPLEGPKPWQRGGSGPRAFREGHSMAAMTEHLDSLAAEDNPEGSVPS
ncbi:hexosaminidase [Crossiella equi]|uniref:beta-N-acetylhexosaminidase n=1 Tax=Crossiella equi TaxID=130796 RepID=A0ABS5ACV9_9PSEU|nr:beta-N-acetylhexosaminidase [Crossiella equi]MBP2474404.1 hexosaminidase [Crossiella equi]